MRFPVTSPLILPLTILTFFLSCISAFTFSTSTPVQCQNFTIQWSGGSGPYHLSLVPTIIVAGGHIENITIPSESTQWSFNLQQPAGLDFLVTMSDSTGFGAGGTTSVLTVGSSDDSSCVPSFSNYDFTFAVNPDSNPSSCGTMAVSWLENATEPVSLFGLIPHGSAFQLPIDQSSTNYDWTVDIQENTQFLLFMSDSGQFQTGGSTPLYRVQSGGNTSCITSSSPTTASGDSMTYATSAGQPTASVSGVGGSSQGGSNGSSSSSHTGAIVGGTVGGVAFLVLLALLLFFCIKRRARRDDRSDSGGLKNYGLGRNSAEKNGRRTNQLDLVEEGDGDETPEGGRQVEMNGDVYEPSPFRYPSPPETPGNTNNGLGSMTPSSNNTPQMLALASEKATNSNRNSIQTPLTPSTNTHPRTSGETYTPPDGTTVAASEGIAETEDSNRATVGHGAGRMSSIRKTPSSQQINTSNALGSGTGTSNEGSGNTNLSSGEARYIQHEDAGVM
uniref:Uncharacterized protein n=1 Tax=Kwoniella pini CBS 10737 TaxID=1296096 RepID=A0A1B9HZ64_9TREE|nr:uncharacterized protein I206_05323 [Kwoniella pini CBS 10737]OCF48544.1 hypothetical protein I206_05323 [Kwoniella pini CBS 10737]